MFCDPIVFILTKQMVVWVFLVLERESPVADMVEILEPLEVWHRHTASIGIEILASEMSCHVIVSMFVGRDGAIEPTQIVVGPVYGETLHPRVIETPRDW